MLGIIGLVLATAVVVALIWKNWHISLVSLAGTLVVILFNRMDPIASLDAFMDGMSSFAGSWFLLFMLGSILGRVMGDSGASVGIANSMLKLMGEKSVLLVIMLAGLVLSYGGIGVFIIAFSLYPIAAALFQKADVPKKFIVAAIMVTPVTVCMTMLPGSPSTQNLIPTKYFNTDAYAGPVLGLFSAALMFVSAFLFLNWQIRKAKKNGEHFVAGEEEKIMDLGAVTEEKVFPIWACYVPIIVLLALMFSLQWFTEIPSAYTVACAMTGAVIVGCILFRDRLDVRDAVSSGAAGGLGALIATSSIMGFGSVVSSSPAYLMITDMMMNMNTNPLVTALISINVISAITGSSSGGLNIFLSSMGGYLAASGLNLSMLHRVVCIASSGFDAMPHASGMVVCNQIAGTSQKDTYKYVFVTCNIMPFCCALLTAVLGTIGLV